LRAKGCRVQKNACIPAGSVAAGAESKSSGEDQTFQPGSFPEKGRDRAMWGQISEVGGEKKIQGKNRHGDKASSQPSTPLKYKLRTKTLNPLKGGRRSLFT